MVSYILGGEAPVDDRHAQILTPAFALSGASTPPSFSSMSSEELDALLAEMEPEIRAADRDLREIDILEKRGVLSAGKLAGTSYARALDNLCWYLSFKFYVCLMHVCRL